MGGVEDPQIGWHDGRNLENKVRALHTVWFFQTTRQLEPKLSAPFPHDSTRRLGLVLINNRELLADNR